MPPARPFSSKDPPWDWLKVDLNQEEKREEE